jgi:hypothetical protein
MTFKRVLSVISLSVVLGVVAVSAQIVSFESPAAWQTLRSDSLIIKAQFDTSRLQKKQIKIVVSKGSEGRKKAIVTKTFTINSYFQVLDCGKVGAPVVGGKEFISLDWSIAELKETGSIAPFGVAVLPGNDSANLLHAKKLGTNDDAKTALASAATASLLKVGKDAAFIPFWSEKALFLVCKKSGVNNQLQFAFDGKNGKNAFLSFPDRFLAVSLKTDSLFGRYYVRNFGKDSIGYGEQGVYKWNNEIKQTSDSAFICVTIPWFDLGVIPSVGRIMGMAQFFANEKGKVSGQLPARAKYYIPGTWGSIVLE